MKIDIHNKTTFKHLKAKSGIYKITNNINGKCYIGQSVELHNRLIYEHLTYKNKLDRFTPLIYKAFDKYGIYNFKFEVIYFVDDSITDVSDIHKILNEKESYYIQLYDSYNKGYNMTLGGENGTTGYKFTDKQKDKLKEATKHLPNVRKKTYIYDVINNKYLTFQSRNDACNVLGINIYNKYILLSKKYISSYDGSPSKLPYTSNSIVRLGVTFSPSDILFMGFSFI
jgi:hypothetical protein